MNFELTCPVPLRRYPHVTLAHGGGGTMTQELIRELLLPAFRNDILEELHDGAVVEEGNARLAFTTDSYVIDPLEFPGGTIGDLAVNGTINDLAMCGAEPLWLSAALIIEEGYEMESLSRIVRTMETAARQAGIPVVTGDTKVVGRGKGDKLFITTAGIGRVRAGVRVSPRAAKVGDVVLINGTVGDHGMAVMSVREHLGFETALRSDTAPLHTLVRAMLDASGDIHVLRDPTRGGVASALNEIAEASRAGIVIDEERIPIAPEVRAACEILGFDPLYVANEGKCIAIVSREAGEKVLEAMRGHPLGSGAAIIGEVVDDHPGKVVAKTAMGTTRMVDMLSGEQLPRIC